MTTKLTLTIDDKVIEKAKMYAKDHKTSVSNMVETYLSEVTKEEDESSFQPTPLVASLAQFMKCADGKSIDYKKVLTKAFAEKHL